LETLQVSFDTAAGGGLSDSMSHGGSVDGELESPAMDGDNGVSTGGGGGGGGGGDGVGGDGGLVSVDGNLVAKEDDSAVKEGSLPDNCKIHEGLDNNGIMAKPHGANPGDLPGLKCNDTVEQRDSAGEDCSLQFLMNGNSNVPGVRKGYKAVASWRFQSGYKPKWAHDLLSGNRSGETEGPVSAVGDGSIKNAPVVACNRSHLKGSATGGHHSKVQKGTGSALKKRKVDKDGHSTSLVRENMLTKLREFRIIYKKLLEDEEAKWKGRGHSMKPDIAAFNIFREKFSADLDDMRYDGSIPGVRIGDVFNSTMELYIVGIHRAHSLSVDYIKKKNGTCLAVSVVSYAQPSASDSLDFLLHVGSVAATYDQKLGGTDVALVESMETDTPVRVIHAFVTELGNNCRPKHLTTYVYGGLYLVEKFHREKTTGDKYVNTFHLRRMAEQRQIDIQVLKTKKQESFDGTFTVDISGGLERAPISAINSISNEHLMTFCYMSQIQYPPNFRPDPPSGCDCVDGCSVSQKCTCAVKNGGGFPYNDIGENIEEKPLIYECGPSCKCPPTCRNRVSQHGIKFRLQVFKTNSMGWGVRTLDFIPHGSFICEYIGELLEEEEAQKRKSDEYLFAIGNNYHDVPRWKAQVKTIPSLQNGPSEDDEVRFTFDALNQGNFARFINHSCTPNLYPQHVLHDHDDISMPHIMFFASENIPPLKELSYDYNYEIDKVYDSDGNIKMKPCFCGSAECTGRLY
jgi:euchromatic histone-lysine N-methyltransferase